MKISKLLVLSALWLTAMSASAAQLIERTKPVFPGTCQGFVISESTDQYYYLYNVNAEAFFTEGNAWGTQASLGETGLKVAFTIDYSYDSAYLFNDFSHAKNAWKLVFFDSETSMFVDLGSQANYRWGVQENGNTFRLFAANEDNGNPGWADTTDSDGNVIEHPAYREGKFVGWVKGSSSTALTPYLEEGEGNCIDWAFVAPDVYEPFESALLIFNAADKLKTAIEEAEAVYVDVANAVAVYNNMESTIEEMNAAASALSEMTVVKKALKEAIEKAEAQGFTDTAAFWAVLKNLNATKAEVEKAIADLNAAVVEWGKTHASVEHPADMTAKIVNPNFDNASSSGWSGTSPNMVGSGSHGPANVAETWNATFDMYQDIADLPAGLYALGAKTSWRGSWDNMVNKDPVEAKLYVKVGDLESQADFNYIWSPMNTEPLGGQTEFGTNAAESTYTDEATGITYYSPNDPSAFRVYEEHGYYDTSVMFGIFEGGARIGVKNPALVLSGIDHWSCYDTFTLTFYGNGADACAVYLPEAMKNFSEYEIEDGTLYTEAYLTAYQQAYAGDHTANTWEELNSVLGSINNAKVALDKNIELWKTYKTLVTKGTAMANNQEYEGIEEIYDLMDYIDEDAEDNLDDLVLTNEELEEEIAKLEEWINTIEDKAKKDVWDGKIMTRYIKNPGFDEDADINYNGAEGWTIDRISGGNVVRGPLGQANQDVMMSVLGEQNFCFESWHCHKWDVWQEIKGLPIGMYELQVQGYVRCEVGGYNQGDPIEPDFPSPVYLYMNSAQTSFPSVYDEQIDASHYDENGELPIVESHSWNGTVPNYPNSMGAASLCFKWGMYKKQAYGLIAKDGDTFRIGVKMDANQDWWCIFDNFKLTYRTPTAELVQPILEEELAKLDLNQAMGKDIYEQAQAVKQAAEEAIATQDGQKMFEALSTMYELEEAINASVALFKELQTAVDNLWALIDTSDNADAVAKAKVLYLQITSGILDHSITDAEAKDYMDQIAAMRTALVLPADIAEASDANPKDVTGVIQTPSFEKDGDNSIEGWEHTGDKFGNSDQLYALALESWESVFHIYQDIVGLPEGTYKLTVNGWYRSSNPTYLYAETTGQSYSKLLLKQGEGMPEGYVAPSSLGAAAAEFDEYTYVNELTFKLTDGKVRIGIRKDQTSSTDWIVIDNFQLWYYGANSALTPDGDALGVENTITTMKARVEFFTLDGRKVNKLQKGIMIQKMTFEDGTVVVRKVRM